VKGEGRRRGVLIPDPVTLNPARAGQLLFSCTRRLEYTPSRC
jgi:hypothetical protein